MRLATETRSWRCQDAQVRLRMRMEHDLDAPLFDRTPNGERSGRLAALEARLGMNSRREVTREQRMGAGDPLGEAAQSSVSTAFSEMAAQRRAIAAMAWVEPPPRTPKSSQYQPATTAWPRHVQDENHLQMLYRTLRQHRIHGEYGLATQVSQEIAACPESLCSRVKQSQVMGDYNGASAAIREAKMYEKAKRRAELRDGADPLAMVECRLMDINTRRSDMEVAEGVGNTGCGTGSTWEVYVPSPRHALERFRSPSKVGLQRASIAGSCAMYRSLRKPPVWQEGTEERSMSS